MKNDRDVPLFVYTSAHVRDLETIKKLAAELATYDWRAKDPRNPAFLEEEGWEPVPEPMDNDIDEGDYVEQGTGLINSAKKKMIRIKYHRIGHGKMEPQPIPVPIKQIKEEEDGDPARI